MSATWPCSRTVSADSAAPASARQHPSRLGFNLNPLSPPLPPLSAARYDFAYLPRSLNMTSTRLGIVGDPSVTSAFSGHLAEWYPGLPAPSVAALDCALASLDSDTNNVYNLAFPAFDGFTLTFPDEAALEAYVASPGYGESDSTPAVFMAVVFDQVGGRGKAGGQWSYKIRANASVIPDTHLMTDDLQRGASVSNIRSYLAGNTSQWATGLPHPLDNRIPGFVPLQLAVDRFILNTTNGNSTASLIDVGMFAATWNCSGTLNSGVGPDLDAVASFLRSHVLLPQHVRIAPFPTSTFMSDDFYSFVESVFALVFVMSFFFPSFFLIRGLVEEKETKLREGMKMMGMSDVAIIAAWYATYAIIFACIAAAVCISLKLTMFGNSDAGLVFLFFWLFGLTATSLCFLISTLFSKAKLASVVGAVLFIAAFFPYFSVSDPLKSTAIKTAASICSPVAFGLALDLIATLESNDAGIGWGNVAETYSNFSFARALAMMVADIVLYTVLGWYFTHVLPQGLRRPRSPGTSPSPAPTGSPRATRTAGSWPQLRGPRGSSPRWRRAVATARPRASSAATCSPARTGSAQRGSRWSPPDRRGLRKEFDTPDGTKVAVDNVDLTMYEGQIFVLLGHNGAGKTTTISMLTGLIPPTSGGATVFGRDLREQREPPSAAPSASARSTTSSGPSSPSRSTSSSSRPSRASRRAEVPGRDCRGPRRWSGSPRRPTPSPAPSPAARSASCPSPSPSSAAPRSSSSTSPRAAWTPTPAAPPGRSSRTRARGASLS
jgi:ATP-binding cassette, subfamily A (ABC1), member 3